MHEQVGEPGTDLLVTSPPSQSPHLGQHSSSSNPMKENRLNAIESSTRTPVASQLQTSEHASVDIVVNNDSNSAPIERSASGKTPHEQRGDAPTRDLKQLAAEVVGQVADTLKIGPLRDVSDLLQGFVDSYKMEGAVKTEYDALQHWLQALLKVLETHSEPSTSPMVASKVAGIRKFIQGELNALEKPSSKNQHGRFLTAKADEERFVGCCRRIQDYIVRLSLDTSLLTWRLEDQSAKDRMSSSVRLLPSSPSAWYNSSA
ncbi:unnamed protein product, partial [Rhizoctonia solani]